jgi:hypothetical protein
VVELDPVPTGVGGSGCNQSISTVEGSPGSPATITCRGMLSSSATVTIGPGATCVSVTLGTLSRSMRHRFPGCRATGVAPLALTSKSWKSPSPGPSICRRLMTMSVLTYPISVFLKLAQFVPKDIDSVDVPNITPV